MQKLTKDGACEKDSSIVIDKSEKPTRQQLESSLCLVHIETYLENSAEYAVNKNIGAWLNSDDILENIEAEISSIPIIAINFPAFADGRGFSLAQQLRSELGYSGEIRAIGQFMEEQLFYLKRCGFDSFIVPKECDTAALQVILGDFSNSYQGSPTEPKPLYRRRVSH